MNEPLPVAEPVAQLPVGVGWTSLLTAYGRAQESREPNPLFTEPLAAAFVAATVTAPVPEGVQLPRLGPARDDAGSRTWDGLRYYFAQRTPFYDQQVLDAVDAGIRQVVVVGAGLDTRAFRLDLPPAVTFFEVDTEPVLEFKAQVLDDEEAVPTCRRIPLVADLQQNWTSALLEGGFDRAQPTCWIVEGLLMYLDRAEADQLLEAISAVSAPGSRTAGEYFNRPSTRADVHYDTADPGDQATWDLLLTSFRDNQLGEPADWMAKHGWRVIEVTDVHKVGRESGRPLPPLLAYLEDRLVIWLFAAELR
ncbi:SAM-dependent methyltransferase [Kribbella sp. NPDC051587]|uniref:SAM-dependent methyltransferase n=1 Tax=Kribbella sp. NPDC051587 TaxID=3364119 RepID=UPI0037B39459